VLNRYNGANEGSSGTRTPLKNAVAIEVAAKLDEEEREKGIRIGSLHR
jgi:hypothetical protein